MSENKKNRSFVERVMTMLKGGDEAKIGKFQNEFIKSNNDQITIRRRELENINERIIDIDEQMEESVLTINLDAIKTKESREKYIEQYREMLNDLMNKKDELEAKSESLEAEIKRLESFNDAVK